MYIFSGTIFSENESRFVNANRDDDRAQGAGGAIDAEGVLRIADSRFINNFAEGGGGAIAAVSTNVEIFDSSVTLNSVREANDDVTTIGGAGISSLSSEVGVFRSSFFRNTDYANRRGLGGAILAFGGKLDVYDSLVSTNSSGNRGGGGIALAGTTATLAGNRIVGNRTRGGGGGVVAFSADPEGSSNLIVKISGGKIIDNSANLSGGGIAIGPNVSLVATDRQNENEKQLFITRNSSELQGGGIFNEGNLRLTSADIGQNSARYGGGVFTNHNTDYSVTAEDNRFVRNRATREGNGIFVNTQSRDTFFESGSVFHENPSNGVDESEIFFA